MKAYYTLVFSGKEIQSDACFCVLNHGKMLVMLLLLSGSVSMGSSEDWYYKKYGDKISIKAESRVRSITFVPMRGFNSMTVLSRDSAVPTERRRGFFMGNKYVIDNLTQKDSGRYLMKDKAQNTLFTMSVEVTGYWWNVTLSPGQYLNITFDLDPNSCNIFFYTDGEDFLLVHNGRLQEDYIPYCGPFEFQWPCGIIVESLNKPCGGRYEFKDNYDNTAFLVNLYVEYSLDPTQYVTGVSVAVIVLLFVCCCCVRRCRRKKSTTKVDSPQTAAAEPAVHYKRYEHEPVILRPSQVSQPPSHHPAQPSCAPTGPLIHSPPTVSLPPAYAEVVASTERPDAPTLPLQSDPGPQFEVKGMTFPSALPLDSDSSSCVVYTSDKLNFL